MADVRDRGFVTKLMAGDTIVAHLGSDIASFGSLVLIDDDGYRVALSSQQTQCQCVAIVDLLNDDDDGRIARQAALGFDQHISQFQSVAPLESG